ncbi:MAG: gliding motility protein GldC [Crocinitomicaceae bacterium]|nr:gliding motility protein GldC [Crocinitomicaceae bacterium]|tara:strand:- start:1 stop:372 length:372 start_codon:yes stop_codon:yes gene_type:complete
MPDNIIKITVSTDDNHVPTEIVWSADGEDSVERTAKAMSLAMWDETDGRLMNMDLWTKNMSVEEMRHFVCQTMMTLADTFERSTSDKPHAEAVRGFTRELAKRIGVMKEYDSAEVKKADSSPQ